MLTYPTLTRLGFGVERISQKFIHTCIAFCLLMFLPRNHSVEADDPIQEILSIVPRSFDKESTIWGYEKLMSESDIVVIARPVNSRVISYKVVVDELPPELREKSVPYNKIGTRFKILSIMAGSTLIKDDTIEVVHFNRDINDKTLMFSSGPLLFDFTTKWNDTPISAERRFDGEYDVLCFLKVSNEEFIPTAGQYFTLLSFRELKNLSYFSPISKDAQGANTQR